MGWEDVTPGKLCQVIIIQEEHAFRQGQRLLQALAIERRHERGG